MVFADLPYGALKQMAWDVPISSEKMWLALSRICVPRAAQVFTANMRFALALIASNYRNFSYEIIWEKSLCTSPFLARKRPLPVHELVLIFNRPNVYNPQMRPESLRAAIAPNWRDKKPLTDKFFKIERVRATRMSGPMYPRSVVQGVCGDRRKSIHPTQKPLPLLEWLIKTYTNPGDTVIDPCMGSGTAGVACARLSRNFVGIEKDSAYFQAASKRIGDERARLGL